MDTVDVLPRDAIPSVDDPAFAPDFFGDPTDEAVVVPGDPARAYPIRILDGHEVVNDVVDGRPVAVTWCPICASAVVYDRRVDGRTLTFGVSGKLAADALVLYDRETGSEWRQPSGDCLAGPFAGRTLDALPSALSTWAAFREAHPDGLTLQPPRDGDPRTVYDRTRYEAYEAGEAFGLYGMRGEGEPRSWDRTDLDPKDVVVGVVRGEDALAYPVARVRAAGGVVRDTVGGRDLLVVVTDAGVGVFAAPEAAVTLRDGRLHGDGTTWDPASGRAADGPPLDRVPFRRLYAFAWQDDHGPGAFWRG